MAFHSKRIDYTVYPPNHKPDTACWDYKTAAKARLAARKLRAGARLRRNVNLIWLHVLSRHQAHVVSLRSQSLPQEMCSTAGFHADQLHLQIPGEGEQLCA